MLANLITGSPASVLAAILRVDPANPPAPGDRHRATFSAVNSPFLPSLMTEVVWMPETGVLDANVEVTGILTSQGWATEGVTTVTAAYAPLPTDAVILVNATSAPVTVTLPDATQPGYSPGQRYTIIKTDTSANAVTVNASAGQLIGGNPTVTLSAANSQTGVVFDGVTSNNWWIWGGTATAAATTGVFGNSSDGALTFDGTSTVAGLTPSSSTYTLTRDLQATSVTVNNGVTVKTANFRVFCRGALVNNGTLTNAGNNASGSTAGASTGSQSLGRGAAGGAGGTGVSGAGAAGGNTGIGSSGGGGGNGTSGTGGAGGTGTASSTQASSNVLVTPYAVLTGTFAFQLNNVIVGGAPGGGGGGSDASSNAGGGGGSGGGAIAILAASAVNNGTITVAGGGGANGTGGNAGGGGGGAGGLVIIYTLSAWTQAGTVNVSGGTKGNGTGTGANGSNGPSGLVLNSVLS